ncbi:MAG: Rne/Rng family ribonuclease [Nostocoides sp.]
MASVDEPDTVEPTSKSPAVSAPPPSTSTTSGDAESTEVTTAPRRRSRRATSGPAAPEPSSPNSASDDESTTAAPAKPKRARATKKASATVRSGDSSPQTEPAAGTAKTSPEALEPKPAKTPRKRASRAKQPAVVAEKNDQAAQAVTPSPDGEKPQATPEGGTSDASPAASTRPPAFGVLFQAPEEAPPRRRRRASSPAGAPTNTAPDDDSTASTDAPEPGDVEPSTETQGQAEEEDGEESRAGGRRRRRRGGRGRSRSSEDTSSEGEGDPTPVSLEDSAQPSKAGKTKQSGKAKQASEAAEESETASSSRRRRRRRRSVSSTDGDDPPGTVTKVRPGRARDEVTGLKGSTRLEAKKQRRREGREAGRRRTIITEAEFLARRESVERVMVVRGRDGRTQIGVLEDDVLVEHYVSREMTASMAGNIYLGRVQNVLPSMEAAFIDIGRGRNAVLYAGEVNWDAAGLEANQPKRIENALSSGDTVLVQVAKDPIGHKGARLTSQISLPGRFLVYVPEGSMTGISRKLPDNERARLKAILKEAVPDSAGVIVRTAAEGASEDELRADVERLTRSWDRIQAKVESARAKKASSGGAPVLLHGEPDLTVRVIRDIFNEDFAKLVVSGDQAYSQVHDYVSDVAPDLLDRLSHWTDEADVFTAHRIDEQLAKAMDRKVWLPSGGSLVIDRTEAMTVIDVNTGKFIGAGGNLEATVTRNNIEAAEEIVRQLRLRDIGGIIVIDFIDMVLESNRDLVVRRLLECLGRDRTKHQVAEVTSLGLVQMTRKRVGSGLVEVFSEQCDCCNGRGIIIHTEPVEKSTSSNAEGGSRRGRRSGRAKAEDADKDAATPSGPTAAQIAAAAHAAALKVNEPGAEPGAGEATGADDAELTEVIDGVPVEAADGNDVGSFGDASLSR